MILHKPAIRMSVVLLLTLILFISLSIIAFNHSIIDISTQPTQAQIHSYVRAACIQWSLFAFSGLIFFLGLNQYWLIRSKSALLLSLIGIGLGVINALTPYVINSGMLGLKVAVHTIPCIYLIVTYLFHYNSIIDKQKKLQYMAAHDALTGLYNRREFEIILTNTIANSARYKEQFAVFSIDIDNFKTINDTLGHMHGDNFLKQFADQLISLTRNGEALARMGGDEFTLIATRLDSPLAAKKIANRLISGLNISYLVNGKWLATSVSIGVSVYPTDGENTDELLKSADIALYDAKKAGKNTYQFPQKKSSKKLSYSTFYC